MYRNITIFLFFINIFFIFLALINYKKNKFFKRISIFINLLLIISIFLTKEIDKKILINSYEIKKIKEDINTDIFGRKKIFYTVYTENNKYILEDPEYIYNNKKTLEVFQKYCLLGKLDNDYYYVINE